MSKAAELAALIGSGQAQGNRNLIINGAMTVDQRHDGSSFTIVNGNSTTGVIADRFRVNETSGVVMTGQRVADAPVGFEYSSKLTVTTADSSLGSTEFHRMIQPIEGKNISNLNWGTSNAKTLTLTFYVKSSLTGQYYISVFNNVADRTLLKGYTISSADTWEKKTITIIGDQSGTWLTTNGCGIYLMWSLGTGATYQSNTLDAYQGAFAMAKSDQVNIAATNGSTFQLTGVQLEVGSAATDFEHRSYGEELLICKRYFEVYSPTSADEGAIGVIRTRTNVNGYNALVNYHEKRAQPSCAIDYDRMHKPGVVKDTLSAITITISAGETQSCQVNATPANDSSISTHGYLGKSSGTGRLTLSAEL